MVAEWRRSKSRRVRDFGSLDEATKKPRGVTRAARPRRRRRDQEHRGRREECVRASEAVNAARARVPAPFRVANTAAGVVILVSAGSDPIKIGHERALSAVLAGAIRALVVLIMPWVPTGRASPKLL